MSEWQPIETAPVEPFNKEKWFMWHSPRLLLWSGNAAQIGYFSFSQKGKGRWKADGRVAHPTHWMPLPNPPEDV